MDKKVLDYVVEKTHELMNAPSCNEKIILRKAMDLSWIKKY